MKYILFILLFIPLALMGQNKKLNELPANAVLHATDIFWTYDQGTTSTKTTGTVLMTAVSDTADAVRGELADTAAVLRSLVGGGGAWSRTGRYIYPTTLTDSVGVGTNSPLYKFHVSGNGFMSKSIADTFTFPNNITKIYTDANGFMYLKDYSGTYSPSSLVSQFSVDADPLYTATYYTTYPAFNWNFGSTLQTSYKMNVAGSFNTTGEISMPTNTHFHIGTSYIYEYPSTSNFLMFNMSGQTRAYLTTAGATNGLFSCTYFQSSQTTDPASAATSEGIFYYNSVSKTMRYSDGTSWLDIGATGSGTFADTVRLNYESTSNKTRWVGISHTKGLYADSTSTASYGLDIKLKSAGQALRRVDGEIAWLYKNENGDIRETYCFDTLSPGQQIGALMSAHEMDLRRIRNTNINVYILYLLLGVLSVVLFKKRT